MSDEDLISRMVTLKGIGRWTVEMFLIYTLERMDVLPADDFGVREGHRRLKSLPTGTTVLRLEKGKIVEEIGLDDGVTALTHLGLIRTV